MKKVRKYKSKKIGNLRKKGCFDSNLSAPFQVPEMSRSETMEIGINGFEKPGRPILHAHTADKVMQSGGPWDKLVDMSGGPWDKLVDIRRLNIYHGSACVSTLLAS